jgi:hypothetical protein
VGEPALSPNGRQVAFTMGGRIGLSTVETTRSRSSRWARDWQDASPAGARRQGARGVLAAAGRLRADLLPAALGQPAGADVRSR